MASEYVVQRADNGTWTDIATVTVAPKTHRRTVIARALEQAEVSLAPDGPPMQVRVLDADSARVVSVAAEQPSPRLVIGDADA